jgi:hypothetical protein
MEPEALLCVRVSLRDGGGPEMSTHCSSNFNLWPQQARPRRAIPSTFAVGGLCVGIVAAISAYNVSTDLLSFEPSRAMHQGGIVDALVYAMAPASLPNPPRAAVSESKSPIIGAPVTGIDINARGGWADGGGGEAFAARASAVGSTTSGPSAAATHAVRPAEGPVLEPKAKPASRDRPPNIHRTVQRGREQPIRNTNAPAFPFFGFFGRG